MGIYPPMRYEQSPSPRIEKCSREPGESFRAGLIPRGGIAGRENHPFGVQPQLRNLGSSEQPIISLARVF
jgi:hypothetical protein